MNKSKLFGLPMNAIIKIQTVFSKYNAVLKVILFGSRAKGTYRPNSDIDLCIEGEQLSFSQLLSIENEIDDLLLPWKIDLSLKHKIDNQALLDHIEKQGVLFFSSLLNRMDPTALINMDIYPRYEKKYYFICSFFRHVYGVC